MRCTGHSKPRRLSIQLHSSTSAGRFCDGLRRDEKALNAAVILPWSNGQVEGQIHRPKLVKRQMYGRGKFNLLRRRVLPYVAAPVAVSPQNAP
jgi:transposase